MPVAVVVRRVGIQVPRAVPVAVAVNLAVGRPAAISGDRRGASARRSQNPAPGTSKTRRSRPMTLRAGPPMSSLMTESVIDHAGPVSDNANPVSADAADKSRR
jgi:hypothetical protein